MIDLIPIELIIPKMGISAHVRLREQLATCFQVMEKTNTPSSKLEKSNQRPRHMNTTDRCMQYQSMEKDTSLPRSRIFRSPDAHARHQDSFYPFIQENKEELPTNQTPGAQRLINLEIPVLVRSLKSSNVELG